MNFQTALLAATGGFAGSLLRFWVAQALPFDPGKFPWGTFLVNMAGCLFIGAFWVWITHPGWKAFAVAGILGGFTTFSGLGLELYRLAEGGFWARGLTYAVSSIFLGTILVLTGKKIAEFSW